mmetsp:Transcript_32153/g.91214  ORF Transcript_32153/g.91214 Transcript_32153/m.91214 type:complete len:439 (+) Transcript_32153:256-1572(+)
MHMLGPIPSLLALAAILIAASVASFSIAARAGGSSSPAKAEFTKMPAGLKERSLPERLLVAYPGWSACGPPVEQAILNGVNVVMWSFGDLRRGPDGAASVVVHPDAACIRRVADAHSGVIHMLSFGGWNSPHPDDSIPPEAYYEAWKRWNQSPEHARSDGSPLFDGFDWDLEGNDDPSSPTNAFSVETLDIMGRMSVLAKGDGYMVSLAPAESYLDPRSGASFSRSLLLDDAAWEEEFRQEKGPAYVRPVFGYHGRNCWAYLLAQYGWAAFDFVSVQFYESYTHFGYDVQVAGLSVSEAIQRASQPYFDGWEVDFSADDDPRVSRLGRRRIVVPPRRFVFGLIALHGDPLQHLPAARPPYPKVFTLLPAGEPGNAVAEAFEALRRGGRGPRGAMYWCVAEEVDSSAPFYMSSGLAAVLKLTGNASFPQDGSHFATDEL